MKFEWESQESKLLRSMSISPKQKLEWLNEMHNFILKISSEEDIKLRWKLRELR